MNQQHRKSSLHEDTYIICSNNNVKDNTHYYSRRDIENTIYDKKLERKKFHAIQELLQSERDYVKDLSHLVEVCLDALYRQQWIPTAHKSLIARNSKEIFDFHKSFIIYFDTIISEYDNDWSFIAHTFIAQMEQFTLYKKYCDLHFDAWNLTCQYRSQPEWILFLQDCVNISTYSIPFNLLIMDTTLCQSQQPHKKLLFEDYLIKPIQRVCRYQLLIKEIIRYTNCETVEYTLWNTVLHKLQHVVTDIDITNSYRTNQECTYRFINRLTVHDWRINKSHLLLLNNFLIAGAIEVTYSTVGHSEPKTRYLGCFVFATYMIMVHPKSSTSYEPKHWFPLAMAGFEDLNNTEEHKFIITCKRHIFAFKASCSAEKKLWVQKIQEAITTSKSANNHQAVTNFIIPSLHGITNQDMNTDFLSAHYYNTKKPSRRSTLHFKETSRKPVSANSIKKPPLLQRPRSMVHLSSSAYPNKIFRRMSMQFKDSDQVHAEIDHRLHDVCTSDYLSSRAWQKQQHPFDSSFFASAPTRKTSTTYRNPKKTTLKKHKSLILCRKASRFSSLSLSEQHQKDNVDFSTHSGSLSSFGELLPVVPITKEEDNNNDNLFLLHCHDGNRDTMVETPESFGSEDTYVEKKYLVKKPSRTKVLTTKMKKKIGSIKKKKNTYQPTQINIDVPSENQYEKGQFGLSYAVTSPEPLAVTNNKRSEWKNKLSVLGIPKRFLN